MRSSFWVPLVLGLSAVVLAQKDSHCILYPAARRADDQRRVARESEFQRFSKAAKRSRAAAPAPAASANFIDDYIFARIAADVVPLAEPTTDTEFVRRIYLDLTGHIPPRNKPSPSWTTPTPESDEPDRCPDWLPRLRGPVDLVLRRSV